MKWFTVGFVLGVAVTRGSVAYERAHPVVPQTPQMEETPEPARESVGACGVDGFVDHVLSHLHEVPTKYLMAMGTACQRLSMGEREVIARELARRRK